MNRFAATPLLTVFAFALVVTLAGALFAPSDVWPNLLIAGLFLSGLGLSGDFAVAIHDASGGRWLGPVRGIALSLTALVLPGSVIALAAIVLGGSMLYPAWHEPLHGGFNAWWLERNRSIIGAEGEQVSQVHAVSPPPSDNPIEQPSTRAAVSSRQWASTDRCCENSRLGTSRSARRHTRR